MNAPSPLPPKNVSLRGGPALTKMRGEEWGGTPLPKNVSLRGPGLTFPNVKNDAGASTKSTMQSVFFFFFLASFLTFGKVNPGPSQTDIFFGEGVPPHSSPLIFVSARLPPSD